MIRHAPESARETADVLLSCQTERKTIELGGRFGKNRLGGTAPPAQVRVSLCALDRVLQYEPKDLTISVEAGLRWRDMANLLAENRQMVPLDPPFADHATVGGVVVSNLCGPRRRWFGSARDSVIGMQFATMGGKLVQSGGMVVKNVAGLDMGKLLIGSLGTLGAVVSVNFKLVPMPPATRTFVFHFGALKAAAEKRNAILAGVLQPWALDLLNPHAAALIGDEGWVLAVQAGGSGKLVERYERELVGSRILSGSEESSFWHSIQEFTPTFLTERTMGCVVRICVPLMEVPAVLEHSPVPTVARAGNGVCHAHFADLSGATHWLEEAERLGWRGVVEFHGSEGGSPEQLWPKPGRDLDVMLRIKNMLDPGHLLNRGRLNGRI